MQNNTNGYDPRTAMDPAFDLGSTLSGDFPAWTWPDPLDATPSPPPPQQCYEHTHSVPEAILGTAGTTPLNPVAESFGQNTAVMSQPYKMAGSQLMPELDVTIPQRWTRQES